MFKKKQTTTPGRMRPSTTGSRQNASVFSYRASRSAGSNTDGMRRAEAAGQAGAVADRRPKPHRTGRAARFLLVVGIVAAAVLNLGVSSTPRLITPDTPAPGQLFLHAEDVYAQAAADILQDSVLYRTKVTINTKEIAREMARQFPELESVVVSLPLIGQEPRVFIEPARPALLLAAQDGEVYVLDTAGKALARLSQAPSVAKLHLPTVSDQSGLPVALGSIALPSTNVAFITEVVGQLKAKHMSFQNLVLPSGVSELQVQVSGTSYVVKFNLHGNARAEVGTYLAVKQQLAKEKKVPSSYIDVRVESRAYYR